MVRVVVFFLLGLGGVLLIRPVWCSSHLAWVVFFSLGLLFSLCLFFSRVEPRTRLSSVRVLMRNKRVLHVGYLFRG